MLGLKPHSLLNYWFTQGTLKEWEIEWGKIWTDLHVKSKHAFTLRPPGLDYRLIGNQAQILQEKKNKKKHTKKALEFEGGKF